MTGVVRPSSALELGVLRGPGVAVEVAPNVVCSHCTCSGKNGGFVTDILSCLLTANNRF